MCWSKNCLMIEEAIGKGLYQSPGERTFIDKLLAKEDVNRLRDLAKKSNWGREDLLETLYLLSGAESKLLNYGEWERYVILKMFVWIREFVKIGEFVFDYEESLTKEQENDASQKDELTNDLVDNVKKMMEHNIKFLVDLYLNIQRSSLSLGATGFLEMLKTKFEVDYKGGAGGNIAPPPAQSPMMKWVK
jgi:hypothetical protein